MNTQEFILLPTLKVYTLKKKQFNFTSFERSRSGAKGHVTYFTTKRQNLSRRCNCKIEKYTNETGLKLLEMFTTAQKQKERF